MTSSGRSSARASLTWRFASAIFGPRSVRKRPTQPIARDDENRHIDLPVDHGLSEVDQIDHDQVASGGELNFYTDAHPRSIHCDALRPVDVSGLLLRPTGRAVESLVDQPAYGSPSVGVARLLHAEVESLQDVAEFIQERSEAEALYPLPNAVIRLLFDDPAHLVNGNAKGGVRLDEDPREDLRK